MEENIIDPNSEIPTVPEMPGPELPPTVPELPDPEIPDIIPNELRQIITDPEPGQNITGANYLTVTPAGEVVTPSGQVVDPGMDLNQIAMDFDNMVNAKLAADRFEIPLELLRNSPKSVVENPFARADLTNIAIDPLGKAKVFDGNQGQSFFDRIRGASLGAEQDRFFDADDANNLIQIKAVDAVQSGGLRAWGGNDRVLGTESHDIVHGNAGDDEIVGAGGNDLLRGGQGNDVIAGGEGDDMLWGNKGDDYLFGGLGNDVLRGGRGVDVLMGNGGNDILIGGGDGDFLIGSPEEIGSIGSTQANQTEADQFILRGDTLVKDAALADRILDFNPSVDVIKIAYFDGTLAMPEIRFAAVDVNLDSKQDTAILCSDGVVGVILSKDPTEMMNFKSSILMVNPKDTALSMIG